MGRVAEEVHALRLECTQLRADLERVRAAVFDGAQDDATKVATLMGLMAEIDRRGATGA